MSVSPARTSEILIYSGGAPHRVLTALAPAFESATGHQLAMTFEIVSRIQERLAAGDRPDLIMLPEELIVETAKIVPLLPQGRAVLARVGIGVIVAEGADHPDLSDEDSVRSALRRAKAIALADPRTPTGRYLNGMLQRLGLLEELQGRLIHKGAIHGGGEEVASGAADIGLYLVSEVAHIADVSVVGLLPPALQNYLAYGAAIPASNQSPDAALAFISFLSEPANAAYWRDAGFEPRDTLESLFEQSRLPASIDNRQIDIDARQSFHRQHDQLETKMIDMRMDGRCALITGASKGIGFAAATNFIRAGANVAIVARRPDVLEEARQALLKEGKGKVVVISADVSKAADCTRIFATAEKELGQVDVLVNNAGTHSNGPFVEASDEKWQADFDLKLFAAIRLSRAAFPGMISRKWGRIINTLNSGAKWARLHSAPTSITRAAGMALTKVLSNEGAEHNVLVNAVLVGFIQTDQWIRGHAAENKGRTYDEYIAEMGARIPMKRVGTSEEFANMILFLASDAGSYVTGTAINVDGGFCPVV